MKLAASRAEYAALAGAHRMSPPTALVPTMGALHEGHRSLIRLARARAERLVVTIFVNPLQFGAGEDFERYPRSLADLCAADRSGDGLRRRAGPGARGGRTPWHFDGVLTVVLKMFHLVEPAVAVSGQKDAQQLA